MEKLFIFLCKIIREKGVVFYRMSPMDKILLVEFLKDDRNNIVGMCGDGSNDSGAIASSDFGILLRNKNESNLINSHFYAENNSIACIEIIIKNGRASLENLFINIKFIYVYGFIKIASIFNLNLLKTDYSNYQLLMIDIFCVFFTVFFSSM